MPITTYIANPTLLCEQTVINYISASFSGSTLIAPNTIYDTAVSQSDKYAPMILVTVNSAEEVFFQSRVYRFNVDVSTRMIAADSQVGTNVTSSAISFGGNVYSLFGQTDLAVNNINALQTGLAALQVQVVNFMNERLEDSWISNCNLNLIGCVVSN